jgi:hypothetical protein
METAGSVPSAIAAVADRLYALLTDRCSGRKATASNVQSTNALGIWGARDAIPTWIAPRNSLPVIAIRPLLRNLRMRNIGGRVAMRSVHIAWRIREAPVSANGCQPRSIYHRSRNCW